jgi:hypothetical protein
LLGSSWGSGLIANSHNGFGLLAQGKETNANGDKDKNEGDADKCNANCRGERLLIE